MAIKKAKKKAQPKKDVGAGPTDHTIHIQVNANGDFKYVHTPGNGDGRVVNVEPEDTVAWRCGNHPVMVLFGKNGSPFDTVVFGGLAGSGSGSGVVLAEPGSYSYLVVVVTDRGVKSDDPDIIVT